MNQGTVGSTLSIELITAPPSLLQVCHRAPTGNSGFVSALFPAVLFNDGSSCLKPAQQATFLQVINIDRFTMYPKTTDNAVARKTERTFCRGSVGVGIF